MALAHEPTYVSHKGRRFLIMDAPTDQNLAAYVEKCRERGVRNIVRACEPTYSSAALEKAGIKVHEMAFADGCEPPKDVVDRWLRLVDEQFPNAGAEKGSGGDGKGGGGGGGGGADEKNVTLAVHCVAGLGRAPVLVAIALVEAGMEPLDAISFIRKRRRGAINAKQLAFLERYERQKKTGGCCVVM